MSNISQFYKKTYPIGAILTLPYSGGLYSPGDGSLWYPLIQTAPFEYNSNYSDLPDYITSPHPLITGPESDSLWSNYTSLFNIAYRPSSPLYVTSTYGYESSNNSFFYYTSTDGSIWTKRYFPNSICYQFIQYTAGKFIAIAQSTTTNGVVTSTDGINWNTANGISLANISDVVSDGGNNIFVYQYSTTTGMYSLDGGATWASTTVPYGPTGGILGIGSGGASWNAGAGLFIASGDTGRYMTSPTGQTWTGRSDLSIYAYFSYLFGNGIRFASNSTTTVALGISGVFATSTDCITFSNIGYVSNNVTGMTPSSLYYDGTRFVARYLNRVFYSTDGTSWTEGKLIGGVNSTSYVSNGILFAPINTTINGGKIMKISDVTATTRQTVIPQNTHSSYNSSISHVRIR